MSYRSKAVAVQTVAMMVSLYPKVPIRNPHIAILIAKSPGGSRRQRERGEKREKETWLVTVYIIV